MGITREEDKLLLKLYEEGVISYSEWQKILTEIYKKRGNASLENISKVISDYTYRPGAKEVVSYLKRKKYAVALISGSMDILVDKVAKELNIGLFESNNIFIFDENDRLDNIVVLGDDSLVKLRHLQSFCRKLGLKVSQCVAVGDGDNDIELFKKTGHGITFKRSKLEKYAWRTIENLMDINSIL
ncbi:MAG TPA: HAD-IB family phosphatase [Candidatus Bathyarchaeia archaeon]|nr:HAD-IB family phosphatase [Candidatus Bathyarchaeia archaeon]